MAAPKNPLKLKRKTHFLACEHLRRFTDAQGMVHVCRKARGQILRVKPDVDGLFNVNGVWSHGAEERMTRAENRFWAALESLERGSQAIEQEVVSEYLAVWRARVEFSRSHKKFEGPLNGITQIDLKKELSLQDSQGNKVVVTVEELLEYHGASFHSTDIQASARSNSGAIIRWFMDYAKFHMRNAKIRWGVVASPDVPLVLPDRTTSFDIPISPHLFLHGFGEQEEYFPVSTAPVSTASDFNQHFFDGAYEVVVANSPDILKRLAKPRADEVSAK
jgi:hypothetical protein